MTAYIRGRIPVLDRAVAIAILLERDGRDEQQGAILEMAAGENGGTALIRQKADRVRFPLYKINEYMKKYRFKLVLLNHD